MLDIAAPDQTLIDLMCRHQGLVTQAALQQEGYTPARTRQLCQEEILLQVGPDSYRLLDELTYFDGRVLLQWAIPGGILAARTALVYHELSLALPKEADVCVPADWSGEVPPGFRVHALRLPPELRNLGVLTVYPDPPGTVPVAIYSPAVAVAQTVSDDYYSQEIQEECLWMYRQRYPEAALQEALRCYQVALPLSLALPRT